MNIDWSKAPSWAIGHALHAFGGEVREVWVGEDQYQRLDQPKPFPYGGGVEDSRHNPRRHQFHYEVLLPAPWDGEGLPPVGTACEIAPPYRDHGAKVRVLCHDEGDAICRLIEGDEFGDLRQYIGSELRPIRTSEQVAEEAREAGINKIIEDSMGRCDLPGAAYLYDAGYRCTVEIA